MSIDNYTYNEDIVNIEKIQFGIFGNREVKNYSAVKKDTFGINLPESYDNFEPKKGGLVDLRLGSCDIHLNCTTCGLDSIKCPGHFGHTELAEPVFHIGFLDHLKYTLSCVCLKCSSLLVSKTEEELEEILKNKKGKHRFSEMKALCKNVSYCPRIDNNCGAPVPKIKTEIKKSTGTIKILIETEISTMIKDETTGIISEGKKKIRDFLSPKNCYDILKNISDTDCKLMGYNPELNRPEDLIIKSFPIPPVIIRPTAKIDFLASSTLEDSMTLKISDILKANIRIRKQLDKESITGEESKYNLDNHHLLQYHVATYFDNESVSLPKSEYKTGGKPSKSVSDRLKGKGGRVRANLMGKRVDFSGRSVITSDPNIDIDEVGIPEKIARDLTFPEEVTPYNIERLKKLVKNGRDIYPGANFVFRQSTIGTGGNTYIIDLKYRKRAVDLNYGDIVERHIVDGDMVLFNRQPTLHKISMMGHKIKVIPGVKINTFRVNVSVTEPYNADFDGDEMNIFVPQSIQTQLELELIANVKRQIISAKDSNPIIGCKQDALVGAYHLTMPSIKLTGEEAMSVLMYTSADNIKLEKNKLYTGAEVFSHIIPSGINSVKYNDEGDIVFEIKDGKILKGRLEKSSLSYKKNSIIHYIWDKYGADKTRIFIDDTQRLILNYLMLSGQTVGFGDTLLDQDELNKVRNIISTKVVEIEHQITDMENDNNLLDPELFEDIMTSELNTVGGNIGKMVSDQLNPLNNFSLMAKSGSKGSDLNIGQIMGCLGQQIIDSKRVQKKVNKRSLPHYFQNDDTPEARGFVASSYVDGLKAQEQFFHTMGGREGLIDTAIKTAVTGYISRKLIKGMEDIHIVYDGTVRNSTNTIIQYCYGDSGVNQSAQTEIKLLMLGLNNQKLKDRFTFNTKEMKEISKNQKINFKELEKFNTDIYNKLIDFRDNMRKIQRLAKRNYKTLHDKYMLPIGIYRIIQDTIKTKSTDQISPYYIMEQIEQFLDAKHTRLMCLNKSELNNPQSLKYRDEQVFKYLLRTTLYEYLSPKRCIYEYKIGKKVFDIIINEMSMAFIKAMTEPGEMVGIIAAQSVGEPTTQMTLNTKHFAGVASKGTGNMGVPRIKELLNYSKNIKTPKMSIYLKPEYRENKPMASAILSSLKYVSIEELVNKAQIFYNPGLSEKTDEGLLLKADKVENPFYANNQKVDIKTLPFVIRLVIDREKMLDKEVTLLDIKTKFIILWNSNFSELKNMKRNEKDIISKVIRCAILANYDTSPIPVIHIRFNMSSYNFEIIKEFFNIVLDKITLKGIEKVDSAEISNERLLTFNDENGDIEIKKQNVVYTDGINLVDIRYIKGIDFNKTSCNDIAHIYYFYGIEAARAALVNEYNTAYESGGSSINYHHLSILVDVMTHTGGITSIDRHGINRLDTDPLARASFEKTIEQLITAGIFNETDYMRSVSSRIMAGRVIKGGTGLCDIMLDNEMLENSELYDEADEGIRTFTDLTENVFINDILSKMNNEGDFFIPE
jgi:DNA-directed RNA polymerase II subunit RPB1